MPTATLARTRTFLTRLTRLTLVTSLAFVAPAALAEVFVGITIGGDAGIVGNGASFQATGAQFSNSLARDPTGRYLTTTTSSGSTRFAFVDPFAHSLTLGNPVDLGAATPAVVGLAFTPGGGLYALNDSGASAEDSLWSIDGAGVGTLLGLTGFSDLTDLAIARDGSVYAWSVSGGLVKRAPGGAFVQVNPSLPAPQSILALTFGADGTTLYGADSSLYRIDTASSGQTVVMSTNNLRGIAATNVPEPATVILLTIALVAIVTRIRRPGPRERGRAGAQ